MCQAMSVLSKATTIPFFFPGEKIDIFSLVSEQDFYLGCLALITHTSSIPLYSFLLCGIILGTV